MNTPLDMQSPTQRWRVKKVSSSGEPFLFTMFLAAMLRIWRSRLCTQSERSHTEYTKKEALLSIQSFTGQAIVIGKWWLYIIKVILQKPEVYATIEHKLWTDQ